jgi:hypothetical protein
MCYFVVAPVPPRGSDAQNVPVPGPAPSREQKPVGQQPIKPADQESSGQVFFPEDEEFPEDFEESGPPRQQQQGPPGGLPAVGPFGQVGPGQFPGGQRPPQLRPQQLGPNGLPQQGFRQPPPHFGPGGRPLGRPVNQQLPQQTNNRYSMDYGMRKHQTME